jgi:hypothetical protein
MAMLLLLICPGIFQGKCISPPANVQFLQKNNSGRDAVPHHAMMDIAQLDSLMVVYDASMLP